MKGGAKLNAGKNAAEEFLNKFKVEWRENKAVEKGTVVFRVHPSQLEEVSDALKELGKVVEKIDPSTFDRLSKEVTMVEKTRKVAEQVKEKAVANLNTIRKFCSDIVKK